MIDDDEVIEEHASVAQLKATNDECNAVTLEECFQVSVYGVCVWSSGDTFTP